MTTRFKAGSPTGVPSGYEGSAVPDMNLPSCGVEDVDRALFTTLRDEVSFQISDDPGRQQRVPIVLAVGEKWSMLKSGKAIRDKNGTLVLPMVTIRRTMVEQQPADVVGRGMNQHVGSIAIRTMLDPRDRAYQNIVNKLGIPNSEDVPGDRNFLEDGTLTTERQNVRENERDLDVLDGGLLAPKLGKNVWQIVSIPTPQFFTAVYEMTVWTQYTTHMNQILERLMSCYLPTGNRTLRLESEKGYWFVATFDEGYQSDDNSSDTTGIELIRKYTATIKVPGYLIGSDTLGTPVGLRSFVSAPQIAFASGGEGVDTTLTSGAPGGSDPYRGADDPAEQMLLTDPYSIKPRPLVPERVVVDVVVNPFTGEREACYARVVQRSVTTGETVLAPDTGIGLKVVSPK